MTVASNQQSTIIRTERGLTIAGTRANLYDVIDFLNAQYPPKYIQDKFNLTDTQINGALSYIEANRTHVEAEYQEVLRTREEIRQYWEERNREHCAHLSAKPRDHSQADLWAKLEAQKMDRAALKV